MADVPKHRSMLELKRMVEEKKKWNRMIRKFRRYGIVRFVTFVK